MKIDWSKYVDQIYCITFSKKQDNDFYKELERVDILDSDIYYEFENIQTPLYEKLYRGMFGNLYDDDIPERQYSYGFDVTIAHYYCMKHAEQHNYNKILILENDNIFLQDKNDIITILDNALSNFNDNEPCIFIGSLTHSIYDYDSKRCTYDCVKIVDYEILKLTMESDVGGGTSFNIYNKKGYKELIEYIESNNYITIDRYQFIYDLEKVNIYYSNTYISVQQNWIWGYMNVLYNYNYDINKKEYYLQNCIDEYFWVFPKYKWEMKICFKQINKILFDNKLDITKYLKEK